MNRFKASSAHHWLGPASLATAGDTPYRCSKMPWWVKISWLITIGISPAAPTMPPSNGLRLTPSLLAMTGLTTSAWCISALSRPRSLVPINTTLGQEVRLVEVKVTESLQPGQTLPVEFVWQSLQQPQADYNLFLQLLTADGTLIAQHDSPPNGGYTPTSTWLPGQQLVSRHALALPPNLPTGTYQLIAGLYNPATGQRLPVDSKGDFVNWDKLR